MSRIHRHFLRRRLRTQAMKAMSVDPCTGLRTKPTVEAYRLFTRAAAV